MSTAERAGALEVLLQSKPNVAVVDALGSAALFYSARRGRVTQSERLVAAGLDPKLRNEGGWSAVDYSVQSRQDAVADYLVKAGLPASRFSAVGYGATQPIAGNDTDQGKAQNRRIDFVVK